jgi:type III pantothenate kinase
MQPDYVVDIGNTRIKWGCCSGEDLSTIVALAEDPEIWDRQFRQWAVPENACWVLASVQPQRCGKLRDWLLTRAQRVVLLAEGLRLPLEVALPEPNKVGIDRLLDAIAAKSRLPMGQGAVLIDAGSAVTVDWLDEQHIFRGGIIFPGIDLMAESLHRYTALLPRVELREPIPNLPATSTIPAIQAGIHTAIVGGIREAIGQYRRLAQSPPRIFFTGGQSGLLVAAFRDSERVEHWPEMTLAGILHAARKSAE